MFLININDILSVWTMNYDILSIPDIDNLYLCDIYNDTFSTWHIDKLSISGMDKSIFVYIACGNFFYT